MRTIRVLAFLSVFSGLVAASNSPPQSSVADWPAYGRDPGGSRYSPAAQINRDNVKELKIAWTYRTGELKPGIGRMAAFEATPIVI